MRFEFRTTTGQICCSTDNPHYLCTACAKKAEGRRLQAPDPYASAYPKVRTLEVSSYDYDPYGQPPDGYAIALKLRKAAEG